ncbi:MAG: PQQ-dependent sugar dehydrogenase [Bdellovibrionales bacterium]|nr:PQQ-dependent sugar dehydrogenase [Bdellovibrionales bacterium]
MQPSYLHFCRIIFACTAFVLTPMVTSAEVLHLPATGIWNGYLRQLNVVECSSIAREAHSFSLEVRDNGGTSIGTISFTLEPLETEHLILNQFPLTDAYGTFILSEANGSGAQVVCHTALYRQTATGTTIEYAYSLPLQSPTTGTQVGLYNSYSPAGSDRTVYNWLSVFNPGTEPFGAQVSVFNQEGTLDETRSFSVTNLAPGARQDFALGHPDGQVVGLYVIEPEGSTAPFGALLTRYAAQDNDVYDFAFPLLAQPPSCRDRVLPLSTMDPATNWVELANPGAASVDTSVEFYDQSGTLLSSEAVRVAPHTQTHLFVNAVLGERAIGSARVRCTGDTTGKALISQSLFYGRSSATSTAIDWAYASQNLAAATATGEASLLFLNTFFGAANWAKSFSVDGAATDVEYTQFNQVGSALSAQVRSLPRGAALDVPFHEAAGQDVIGLSLGVAQDDDVALVGELLRVFPSATSAIGYIMNVPAVAVPAPDQVPQAPTPTMPTLALAEFVSGLSAPVYVTHAGDDSGRLFVVEQPGRIRLIEPDGTLQSAPYLNLTDRVVFSGERGLLSVAFHPQFATNGRLFVNYTGDGGTTQVSEFTAAAPNANSVDAASERVILSVEQPFGNHNGGQLQFGPDGMLYIGMGDGGSGGDPLGHGQNLQTLLGALLRIDVDGSLPYEVPDDNPFTAVEGAKPEIWAYGFRNPWRFSFDRLDGRLFLGDVGQSSLEEVDIVTRGANYGWNTMEGTNCYPAEQTCDTSGLALPIAVYGRSEGVSITGGYLYRGTSIRDLYGKYLFGDFGSQRVFLLSPLGNGMWQRDFLFSSGFAISSFGEDEAGELYIVDYNGRLLKVTSG